MEEIVCELERDEQGSLPPGFRFHPTDEELITFYLASKVFNGALFCGVDIVEVDLNRCEPWELPEIAKMGEREWYFFSLRDRKYPTGLRTNRATGAGYWKATGKDREVYSASSGALLGMKKTLVFYRGRAPRGQKTKWVMHEYRLDGQFSCRHTYKEEWVICRIFHKIGEKMTYPPIFQPQNCRLIKTSSTGSCSLPPLLEPPPPQVLLPSQSQDCISIVETLNQSQNKNPFDPISSQNDIFSFTATFSTHPSSSFIQPTIQDFTIKELSNVIAKRCKKEYSSFSPQLQILSDGFVSMQWDHHDRVQENNKIQNPFLLGHHHNNDNDGGIGIGIGIPCAVAAEPIPDQVMSTEPAFRYW